MWLQAISLKNIQIYINFTSYLLSSSLSRFITLFCHQTYNSLYFSKEINLPVPAHPEEFYSSHTTHFAHVTTINICFLISLPKLQTALTLTVKKTTTGDSFPKSYSWNFISAYLWPLFYVLCHITKSKSTNHYLLLFLFFTCGLSHSEFPWPHTAINLLPFYWPLTPGTAGPLDSEHAACLLSWSEDRCCRNQEDF